MRMDLITSWNKISNVGKMVLGVLVVGMPLLQLQGADWNIWRGPARDGRSPERVPDSLPKDGPATLWRAKVGMGFTAVSVQSGRVYTMGNVDKGDVVTLWCLDEGTGERIWSREWPSPLEPAMYEGGPNSTPVVVDGSVYAVIKPSRVVRVNAATGRTEWDVDVKETHAAELLPWGICSAPVVEGKHVLVNYGSNGTVLDRETGEVRWMSGKKAASFNVPALASIEKEPVAMVFATNALVAVRLGDGEELWRHPFGEGYFCHSSDPVVSGSEVFISSSDHGGELIRFDEGKPVSVWKQRAFGNFMTTPVLKDGYMYGVNACDVKQNETAFTCVSWETGEVLWKEAGYGWGSFVAVEDDKWILLSDKGEMTVARATPKGFEVLHRFHVLGGKCWTPPVLSNGKLYVRNAAGDLVCLDLTDSRAS